MAKATSSQVHRELKRRIDELIQFQGGGANRDLVGDIIGDVLGLLEDVKHRGDVRVIQTAVRELHGAFRLFTPYAGVRKVTIFGSARLTRARIEYQQAVEFGRKIAAAGFMVITGAGPGIMQAGHEGAGPDKSFGVNIRLPWEQNPNPIIERNQKLIHCKYFFTRKLIFLRHADALALFPGGFGTLDEGYEALTLMQTGKSRLMPLVLIDRPGGTYWKTWHTQVREHLLRNQLISEEDLNFFQITDRVDEAVQWITRFYRNFHSLRFVKDRLVIRLQNAPSTSALRALNTDFADLIAGAPIQCIQPTPDEREEEDCVHLPRIALGFNRRQWGRLRQMIDVLNGL
jgi:uncharacterized protein (TIGR00730 family)